MRTRLVVPTLASLALACGVSDVPNLPGQGQTCTEEQSCAAGLSCVGLVCRDDQGPSINILLPEAAMTWASDVLELQFLAALEGHAADDLVFVSMTPATDAYSGQGAVIMGDQAEAAIVFTDDLASGPYHLRAQVTDASGLPYENPSAMAEQVMFVRDATIADTPQVAIVWPPAGYEHPAGVDLPIEVAVLPGSFEIADSSNLGCEPLPGCTPAFAPECEDSCGPVSREGHVKIYVEPDYPDCLLDEPIGCNGDYVLAMRPGASVTVEGSTVRGVIPAARLNETGPLSIHAALSYSDHDPYPSAAAVIHERIEITIVE